MRRPLLLLVTLCLVVAVPSAWILARGRAAGQPGPVVPSPPGASSPAVPAQPAGVASQPAAGLSPRNANYSIDVALDPARRRLSGRQLLTWRNTSTLSTSELQFHLYYNAWKNTRSTWLRDRPLAGGRRLESSDWGWTDVSAIRLVGAGGAPPIDLSSRARHISPDDGNPNDETVMSVALPRDVGPGETVNIEMEWTAQVPRTFARTGAVGDYHFLAQWFPKIGVLEESGWNCHQFHGGTEFYADYGVYDVRLRVPTGWVVGATGRERERRDNGDGTTTHRYYQEDVHDFAWTTSPDYLVRDARFEHAGLPAVTMRLLLQPEHEGQANRHFDATRAALRFYGTWFGAYPYGHVTVVDPAWQSGAGGMEYPTLFTSGTRWLAPADVADPEGVTIHECGHQFWYGIVGNNEFEDAWMDEGFNTFSTGRTVEQAYTPNFLSERFFGGFIPWVNRDIPLSRATDENGWPSYRRGAELDAQSTPSWRYSPGAGGPLSYSKTALWLHTLERHLGWPTLQRILSTFFERWKFRHPKPADFFAVVNEVSGRDMTWFFDQVYRSSDVFDYAVEALESAPVSARGWFDHEGRPAFDGDRRTRDRFQTRVVVRRLGESTFPVDVLVTFENGATVRERWDGRDRWKRFDLEGPSKAVSAQVDPDRVLLLDVNFTNNSVTLRPRTGEATRKWTVKWMGWLQDALLTFAFFI